MLSKILSFLGACTLFLGMFSQFHQTTILQNKLGNSMYEALETAQEAKIFQLAPHQNPEEWSQSITFSKRLTAQELEQLKALILDDQSYAFDQQKKTPFLAQLAFAMKKDEQEIVFFVCQTGQQIKFLVDDKSVVLDDDPMEEPLSAFLNELLKVENEE